MTRQRAKRLRRALACALLACALPAAARAAPACQAPAASPSTPTSWSPPLDRALEFRARDLSLRDALDLLSAAARIRISYSAELLPLERRVCVSRSARTVGDALAELLRETSVEPVVAGADHVVLAPRRAGTEPRTELGRVVPLERVVVTGSAGGGPQASLPYAIDVISGEQLERQGTAPLTRILATGAAGPWGWEQSPVSMLARYGSIRGASGFGVSAPKVFIDGIEVANPLLVTQIAPEAVERVEVIRGPQGAALYGTDAISGVVNIVTRHEGTDSGAPPVRVRTTLGRSESAFAGGALAQEHAIAYRRGSSVRSAGVDVGFGGLGEFLPDGGSRYLLASASGRQVGARSIVTGIARFYQARAGSALNPQVVASLGPYGERLVDSAGLRTQRMRQYTLGGSIRFAPDERWTHSLVAGIDGDRLEGVPDVLAPVPFPAEGGWRGTSGGADRGTLRLSSVGHWQTGPRTELTVTLAAEHSLLREQVSPPALPDGQQAFPLGPSWTQSTGLVALGNVAVDDRVHLTGGLRLERNEGLAIDKQYAALPVVGAAWLTQAGGATLKLRAAYGSGTRPARTPGRDHAWSDSYRYFHGRQQEPERQSGFEGGVDLSIGDVFAFQLTAYDQQASGLIQRVAVAAPDSMTTGKPRLAYSPQAVGQISNRGWEMQGLARLGAFSLEGAAAGVDSRVRRVLTGYGGELRAGDRMLEVPALTLSGTAAWTGRGASASLTAYRAFDWINYDRLALARDFQSATRSAQRMSGAALRDYWRGYDGVTRVNATVTVELPRGTTLFLAGDNLLDRQQGEPDNLSVVPGRTLMLGVRASF